MTDVLAVVRWWAALTGLGLAAWPLVYTLLRRLPDRGFAFVRPAGLLLVAYVYWLASSLGFAAADGGGIVLALLVVAALSWLAYRRRPAGDVGLRAWLRANWTTALAAELVFAGIFALWVYVRAQNPAISATEKPMEFAFLNGVGRSPSFPPLDPWLSGYAVSYYYFGYVMTSLLARLAFVAEPVAFNLAIAWLVAGTAVGAFGIVYNLVSLREVTSDERRVTSSERSPLDTRHSSLVTRRSSLLLGLIAALAVPLAGNLQVGLELLHGNGVGPATLWAWLDVRDVDGPAIAPAAEEPARYETTSWWWWRASRVIHEYHLDGRAEEGLEPIVEAPAFSFILGDLHPHVLALPFAFLSLAVALAWWLEITNYELRITNSETPPLPRSPASLLGRLPVSAPLWLFTALVLGGLSFLNTWDVGIHLFVVLGAFFLAHWLRGESRGLWRRVALTAVALVVAAALLYLPFYLGFRSQAGPPFLLPMLMRPTRLVHYLIIFGMPLVVITVWLVALVARQRFRHWRTGLGVAAALVGGLLLLMLGFVWLLAAGPESGRIVNLAAELGRALPPRPEAALAPGWGVRAVVGLLPALLGARLAGPWLTLFLAGLAGMIVMVWKEEKNPQITQISQIKEEENPQMTQMTQMEASSFASSRALREVSSLPFVLLLIFTGVLLTLGPEFVYLRDNFGVRLNTTFKFYYQAWALFGVAAVVGLDYLWAGVQGRKGAGEKGSRGERESAPAPLHPRSPAPLLPGATTAIYMTLLAVGLLFPLLAARSRAAEYRGSAEAADGTPAERQPATLDGLAYLNRYNPAEYEALMWLRGQATDGEMPPVVLEAVGGQYSGYGRVAANTGLPTVLGWPGHEWQWRGGDHPEPGRREPIVEQIYKTLDLTSVAFLLDEFGVDYVYVGDLEREKYGAAGLEKFAERLEVAFENERVTIYRWQPAAN